MRELLNQLTVRNAVRLLVWCIVLWIVMISGALLAGFICGLVIYSKPAQPEQVVKYVDRPVTSPASTTAGGSTHTPLSAQSQR